MSKPLHNRTNKESLSRNALLFAALGDETRLKLLVRLGANGPQSIKELTSEFSVTRQAITKHLRVLEDADFVSQRVIGREHQFVARPSSLEEAHAALKQISLAWDDALIRLKNFVEDKK